MLSWAATFLVIAIIAGVLGYGGVSGTAIEFAKVSFVVFLSLSFLSLLFWRRGPSA